MEQSGTQFRSASELLGQAIRDVTGATVGYINELIVDLAEGRIAYVVVVLQDDPDSVIGRVTIPWSVVSLNGQWRVAAKRDSLLRIARSTTLQ